MGWMLSTGHQLPSWDLWFLCVPILPFLLNFVNWKNNGPSFGISTAAACSSEITAGLLHVSSLLIVPPPHIPLCFQIQFTNKSHSSLYIWMGIWCGPTHLAEMHALQTGKTGLNSLMSHGPPAIADKDPHPMHWIWSTYWAPSGVIIKPKKEKKSWFTLCPPPLS